jgi:hypothetical protein
MKDYKEIWFGVSSKASENKKIKLRPSTVAHIYNPSYSGGRDLQNYGSRLAQVKKPKVSQTPSQ